MGSSRFPSKVLQNLGGKLLLERVVDAARASTIINKVVVATTSNEKDRNIQQWCKSNQIDVFIGDENNVLKRYYDAATKYQADIIVRLTADCPFLDSNIIDQLITLLLSQGADYASNTLLNTWPDGIDCEAFHFSALNKAYLNASKASEKEHVTPYIIKNRHLFKCSNLSSPIKGIGGYRWTIDTIEDLQYLEYLLSNVVGEVSTWTLIEAEKSIKNSSVRQKRNEGYKQSVKDDCLEDLRLEKSKKLLQDSLKIIPFGSQTFSKSYLQFPQNTTPMFLTHGSGSTVWDVDGNEYVDLISGLLSIILGYNDLDVNYAIQEQMINGTSFSLSTELEIILAEKLCDLIPCAEKVKFGKNGTDVTSAAVRLARAYTDRNKVMVCGYHGWQDWYIGTTTRNKGIPEGCSTFSQAVAYNDLDLVESLLKTEEYACFILEPCNATPPQNGYLLGVKELCEKYGSILIFDEIITGFRFALGGAQEYFGVTPHLSCFGKAMGNGMPISALVGRSDIMDEMDNIFYSGTFGGETLSIACAIATIDKIKENKVIPYLWESGDYLCGKIESLISQKSLSQVMQLNGFSPWKLINFGDYENATSSALKTLFIQEMTKRGILINSSLNLSFAHRDFEKEKIIRVFEEVLEIISNIFKKGYDINNSIHSPVITPLFEVR